jgi:hypothetical protein
MGWVGAQPAPKLRANGHIVNDTRAGGLSPIQSIFSSDPGKRGGVTVICFVPRTCELPPSL